MNFVRSTAALLAAMFGTPGSHFYELTAAKPYGRHTPFGYIQQHGGGHGGKHKVRLPLAQRRARRKVERHNRHAAQRRLRQAA